MAVTTPDTSAVRAWARKNGYDVADRGRLPAEVQDAYVAAHRKGSGGADGGSGETAGKAVAPARKAGSKTAAPSAATKKAAPPAPPRAAAEDRDATSDTTPRPKPSPVTDDRRLVALGEELAALTERVAVLEAASGGRSSSKSGSKSEAKSSRFRRSR